MKNIIKKFDITKLSNVALIGLAAGVAFISGTLERETNNRIIDERIDMKLKARFPKEGETVIDVVPVDNEE